MDKYDAIVVGAGTAGCLAAKTMAQKGLKVCIVEKKPKAEEKKPVVKKTIEKKTAAKKPSKGKA